MSLINYNTVEAQIRRVNAHPAAIVPEDLDAARAVWAESQYPCVARVQRRLGIGYNYAVQLVAAMKGNDE